MGNSQCSISDTYWQTETGGHIITPLPGATPTKPGSACFPFFGVVPEILDEEGKVIEGEGEGYIVFKQPWPGRCQGTEGRTAAALFTLKRATGLQIGWRWTNTSCVIFNFSRNFSGSWWGVV